MKRLESKLSTLDLLHTSLLTRHSAVPDPLERIMLRENLSRTESDRRHIKSQIAAIDLRDMTTAYKLKPVMFKLDPLNREFDELKGSGMLFRGGLALRKL